MTRSAQHQRPTTTELVTNARVGDPTAWRQLVDRYTPLMWAVTRSFRLDHATRADVVQSAWVALAEHLQGLREPEAIGGWLAMTVRRACLHELGRSGRVDLREDFAERDVVDPEPAPDERAAMTDRDARLWRAVRRLPERDQRLLELLTASQPMKYAEIALALGMPVGSIGPTRARCLERLREQLVQEGIADRSAAG
jgi:RNA polymerase sigma factor (sigma-70 family)